MFRYGGIFLFFVGVYNRLYFVIFVFIVYKLLILMFDSVK